METLTIVSVYKAYMLKYDFGDKGTNKSTNKGI
jgi:hypothetical protein